MDENELRLLRDSVREALTALSPSSAVREQMAGEDGWDRAMWRRLCRELGLAGFMVPEEHGGGGFSAVELGGVFEEAGRTLLCAPLLATAGLAIPLLLALGDPEANKRYLPGLCDGSLTATVVTADASGRPLPGSLPVELGVRDGVPAVSGTAGFVLDGATAGVILVPVRAGEGTAVYAVDTAAPGVTVTPLMTLDRTRRQAKVSFRDAPAVRVGEGDATPALEKALDLARAMLAAEQAGGAAVCLETAVEYGKTRVQFGRPIGSFQAFKQKAASLLIQVESARSAAEAAAQAAAAAFDPETAVRLPGLPELETVASVAQLYCSEAYVAVAAENIQLHGGIGFTWEHDAHLYFKRAWASREMLGRPEEHTERLAGILAAQAVRPAL
ncbi:acyl-CoA dehydrogenase family protein [Actinocorallia populi]|uniref:acyl-CoA dehydrogenase family protein n=1 Tax=Actinocorallia populi TaxID=2079200 RepID=UPI000D08FE48|nr:acyl-CoA dehydrogenase family protein [Actinocorallia populi]